MKLKEILKVLQLIEDYESFLEEFRELKVKSPLLNKLIQLIPVKNIHQMGLEEVSKLKGIPEIGYVAESIKKRCRYDTVTGHLEPAAG